jgi:hypothetical protein
MFFQVSSFKFQVSSFKFQVSSFKFQVSSFKFQVSSFEFQVSSFEFQVSSFEFRVREVRIIGVLSVSSLQRFGLHSRVVFCFLSVPTLGFSSDSMWFN